MACNHLDDLEGKLISTDNEKHWATGEKCLEWWHWYL